MSGWLWLLLVWTGAAVLSLGSYALTSYWFDRHLVLSTWIGIWLAGMVLLGPLGSLLTLRFLTGLIREIRTELRHQQLESYPRPTRLRDRQARCHYFPPRGHYCCRF